MTVLMAKFREKVRVTDGLLEALFSERDAIERDGIEFKAEFQMGGDTLAALAIDYPQAEVGLSLLDTHENSIGRVVSAVNEPRPMLFVTSEPGAAAGFSKVSTVEEGFHADPTREQ